MNTATKTVACILAMLALSATALSQEWRGISLLKSTCEDVKHSLAVGKCDSPMTTYELLGEKVTIFFSQYQCPKACPAGMRYWDVPSGTVTSIVRTLDNPLPLTGFNVDNGKWDKILTDFTNEVIYGNSAEGLMLSAVGDKVKIITYVPSAANERLLCPSCSALRPSTDTKVVSPGVVKNKDSKSTRHCLRHQRQ
jgi:hypothetical protein